MMKAVAAAIAAIEITGTALAAGDAPVKLDKRQATAEYDEVRRLLNDEGRVCPAGQVPVSGLVTGGAAPIGGSRTTTIMFDKGATVRIVRRWSGADSLPSSALTVTCDGDPTTSTVAGHGLSPPAWDKATVTISSSEPTR